MATIGYHSSQEQFAPSELLRYVQAAERAGFTAAMSADHFQPWSERQGQSGFTWSWLGAALHATSLPFGVVNAPGYRYHPAIIAQAAATLAELFPGRFWVALGSGQYLNESIVGEYWPPKPERNERLRECVEVIRALWAGETVTHHGRIHVEEAKLWTLPPEPPKIIGPALTTTTAKFVGGWADGLITINTSTEQLQQLIEAFRCGGGDGKPLYLQVHLSYARTQEEALANAMDQWRTTVIPGVVNEEIRSVRQFDALAPFVREEDVAQSVLISCDVEQHIAWLRELLDLGFEHLYLHNVGRNQQEFIEVFGERVLPALCAP